ncbi:ribokinase [Crenobacter sp. SG2305]|uniref:ribokinase n=1 Tax=Crenobacter oryzisoli TaxID=3056844 RepID=UPI0025AB0A37|nr:ribokinase [Crenobacter sp. SG2305]MDN0084817.1 ribokinase [Crenobacter sp. SG2305]
MPKVVVVGSINMDLVAQASRFPEPGETLSGERFVTCPGGKGANQAVAASRLGAQVVMVGAVGDDAFGRELVDGLDREGVVTRHVKTVEGTATGVALITVAGGENTIIVIPGANHALTPADVEAAEADIASADVVLTQLEVPLATVETVAILAEKHGVPLILNPAPAAQLPAELLARVTLLTPNEHELALALNQPGTPFPDLLAQLPGKVVMTRGEHGAYHVDTQGAVYHQPGFKVDVVDTTGAGDTYNAALAAHLQLGLKPAMRAAAAAAAMSVTRFGAQGGMPTADELAAFLAEQTA